MDIIQRRRRYVGGLPTGYSNTGALALDGTNDFIQLPYMPQAAVRNSFTVGMWIKGSSLNTGNGFGNLKYLFAVYKTFNVNFLVAIDAAGKIRLDFQNGSASMSSRSDGTPYSSGATGNSGSDWEHIGIVVTEGASSGDATTAKMFINGSEVASTATSATMDSSEQSAIDFSSGFTTFGAFQHSAGASNFIGQIPVNIDEMAMWTAALDAAAMLVVGNPNDIKDLTEDSGNYDNASALEFYYKLNEGTGATAADFSGNGNTAALINSPSWISGASN